MFPFNLPGPAFLLFFVLFVVAVIVVAFVLQDRREAQWSMPKLDVSDPYKIACLWGGLESLQVALMSLIDRGIIGTNGDQLKTVAGSVDVRRPIEKELVQHFAKGGDASRLAALAKESHAVKAYELELKRLRLLAGPEVRATRWPTVVIAMAVVEGVALAKLGAALMAGRGNVGFLMVLAALALIPFFLLANARGTGLARKFLKTQQTLFKGLKRRASSIESGGRTADLAILAAVFGMAAVPVAAFPFLALVVPKRESGSDGGSSDSSGDSGCGGGGGCGGCGS